MIQLDITIAAKLFYAYEYFCQNKQNIILCFPSEESALLAEKQLSFLAGDTLFAQDIIYFPSFDTLPYDRLSPSNNILTKRANNLTKLATSKRAKLIVTKASNLLNKLPSKENFTNSNLLLTPGSKININHLANFLTKNSFNRMASAVDSGEFAIRGEIIDIVTSKDIGYRINFGWDVIESIREFDPYSQISKASIKELTINLASECQLTPQTIEHFKKNFLQNFGVNHVKNPLYASIIAGKKFRAYEHLLPLFYQNTCLLTEFIEAPIIIYDNLSLQTIIEHEASYNEFYKTRLATNKTTPDSFYFALPPERLIASSPDIQNIFSTDPHILITGNSSEQDSTKEKKSAEQQNKSFQTNFRNINPSLFNEKITGQSVFTNLLNIVQQEAPKIAIIFVSSQSSASRVEQIIKTHDHQVQQISYLSEAKKNLINITIAPLQYSLISTEHLFIAEKDLFGQKLATPSKKSAKQKLQNILTEIDNITKGEKIIHKEHGVGKFDSVETLYVEKIAHDCIKLIYANDDVFYLPVEHIDQLKKFSSEDQPLDRLGSASWQKRKSTIKQKINDIAKKLVRLSARRALAKIEPTEFDREKYEEFVKSFPFSETEDQLTAIEDIKNDLTSGRLMDRLICGDVGFGKTEIAMRAAFISAFNQSEPDAQVAIITPTTILCKQHFSSFTERFKSISVNIRQLSRLIKPLEARRIKSEIADGQAKIIIGTHSLLSRNIEFKNLKLLIIDEEQHFGVAQKEYLKELKTNIHVLSLSATPIPRTLQMSMVGIKDLSLISTPPIDRLPVRTHIIPFDIMIIREALMRERARGGLSFYVAPRIKDIEWIEERLKKFIPELTYKIAHGQMPAKEVDQIMEEFCAGKFDILLSTTIIESGIDIATANTMIIHRADMLGLSQLYQLRGRVGRGKVRGFTYLTLPLQQTSNKYSLQRLDILQNIESLGAGFTIASHDMDLRGFGNLIGDEQAGHIKEIGTELYQEMLDEAIENLKTTEQASKKIDFVPNVNLNIPVLIPATYIEDATLRLTIYRRSANLKTNEEIEQFKDEMIDRFGALPAEFNNLLAMIKIKNHCLKLKIASLDNGANGFVLRFAKNFDVAQLVLNFVEKNPKQAKIKPDNKLIFLTKINQKSLLKLTSKLLNSIEYSYAMTD